VSALAHKPAIFLDRDGVIVENRADYIKSLDEVHILPGALAALASATGQDCRIIVVTNQSVIGRGLLSEAGLRAINASLDATIRAAGGRIDAWYFCPHHPRDGCACRKPKPGMLLDAATDWNLDLPASVLIGDAVTDLQAARAAGARAIMVRTGLGHGQTAELSQAGLTDVPVVRDLSAALAYIASARLLTR
jgi:D-glycero-D-manno-heptose 1,7-bisphosphate phosphatase